MEESRKRLNLAESWVRRSSVGRTLISVVLKKGLDESLKSIAGYMA
jgi:hypothetical protein